MSVRVVRALRASGVALVVACAGTGAGTAAAVTQIEVRPGLDSQVSRMTQPDANGVRYLGGQFTRLNPWGTGPGAAFTQLTGDLDRAFPKVGGGSVDAVVPDGQGGFYIGGSFTCLGGDAGSDGDCTDTGEVARARLAHITSDGSVDPGWKPTANGAVMALALSPDGTKVYMAGFMSQVNGQPRNSLAMVTSAGTASPGTLDANWAPVISSTPTAMAVVPATGDIVVGGGFAQVNGSARNGIAILSGTGVGALTASKDTPSFGFADGAVNALAVNGTTIYAGGTFTTTTAPAVTRNRVAAFNAVTGVLDTTWNPNVTSAGGSIGVNALAVSPSGPSGPTLFLGGAFTTVGAQTRAFAAEVYLAGPGAPTPWNAGAATPVSPNNAVDAIAVIDNPLDAVTGPQVYLAGRFTKIGTARRQYAASVTAIGAGAPTDWDPHPGPFARHLALSGSHIYVAGTFPAVGGTPREGLAAVDSNGDFTSWAPQATDGEVRDIVLDGDNVYIAGLFDGVDGQVRDGLARISTAGVLDPAWTPKIGGGTANALAIAGGTIYLGGNFTGATPVGGVSTPRTNLAGFTSAGTLTPWAPTTTGTVSRITAAADAVYVAGSFGNVTPVGGVTTIRTNIAAFNTAGGLLAFDPQPNAAPSTIVPSGSTVYLGGPFSVVHGQTRHGAAAVDATGTPAAWDPNIPGYVGSMSLRGSTMYIGGNYTTVSGQPRASLAAVDTGGVGTLLPWNPGADDTVYALSAAADAVWVAGIFNRVAGVGHPGVARIDYAGNLILPPVPGMPGTPTTPDVSGAPAAVVADPASPAATDVPLAARPATGVRRQAKVRVGRSRAFALIAGDALAPTEGGGRIVVRVAARSRSVCSTRGTIVRGLRAGTCRYTVTTFSRAGARLARTTWSLTVIPRRRG